MTTIKAFVKRHPVLTYFVLAFVISWGGVLIVVGPGGIPGTSEQFEMLFPFVYLAMLMHASLTASVLILGPLAIAGVPLVTYDLVLAAALWVVVAAVAVANGGHLSRQPLRRRVASKGWTGAMRTSENSRNRKLRVPEKTSFSVIGRTANRVPKTPVCETLGKREFRLGMQNTLRNGFLLIALSFASLVNLDGVHDQNGSGRATCPVVICLWQAGETGSYA